MELQNALISGASVGLTIAAPIGPMAVIVIRRTLSNGVLVGVVTGAGASTVHVVYATLALCGIDRLARETHQYRTLMGVVTALILVFFAARMFRPRQLAHQAGAPSTSLIRHYATALAFNSVNPMGFALTLGAVTAVSGLAATDALRSAAIAGGVFAGSLLWWIGIVTTTATIGTRFSPRVVRMIDLAAGTVLLGLAVSTVSHLL